MIRRIFRCLTKWTHNYGWPLRGVQTCRDCGRQRQSTMLELVPKPKKESTKYEDKRSQ